MVGVGGTDVEVGVSVLVGRNVFVGCGVLVDAATAIVEVGEMGTG